MLDKINTELDRIEKALEAAALELEKLLLEQQVNALKRAMKVTNVTGIVRINEAGNVGLWFAVAMLTMAIIVAVLVGAPAGLMVKKIVGTLASL